MPGGDLPGMVRGESVHFLSRKENGYEQVWNAVGNDGGTETTRGTVYSTVPVLPAGWFDVGIHAPVVGGR